MKLSELISGIKCEVSGKINLDISGIEINSNNVTENNLFVCIKGQNNDSHFYVKQVELYGGVAIVCTHKLDTSLTQIIVDDTRETLSYLAGNFYHNVHKKMDIIGVVGTNGKTTTCHLIKNALESSGVKCGVIGTIGTYYNDKFIEPELTTPDPLEFHKILSEMYNNGIQTVVMEVSAHAIYLDKVKGVDFLCGIFTNFSQDHLDFFENMDNYKQAKLKFFRENKCKYIITNMDDEVGREISRMDKNIITYGINNPSDVFAINLESDNMGSSFVINLFDCIYDMKINLIGKFNIYNTLASATCLALMGINTDDIIRNLQKCTAVKGRLEKVYDDKYSVYVDYAHTPDGLLNSLSSLYEIKTKRLICVFGCGGNRDKSKRAKMGKISGIKADFTIITTDNPRFEEPMDIINEIEKGVREVTKSYVAIENRVDAIIYALQIAKEDDIILIAGKGDEKYQDVLGIKKQYNDKDTVKELLGIR